MDDLLITIIVAGIGLSIAYLRAELVVRQDCVNCTSQDRAVNTLPRSGNRVRFPGRFKQILSNL